MTKHVHVDPKFFKDGGHDHADAGGDAVTHENDKRETKASQPHPGSTKATQIERARSHSKKK
jgi:hypothetical protein